MVWQTTEKMNKQLIETIRVQSAELSPQPVHIRPRIGECPHVRAVIFDVYGTLFISASGDVGTAGAMNSNTALSQSLQAAGFTVQPALEKCGTDLLKSEIKKFHEKHRGKGVNYPEVEIRYVWQEVLRKLLGEGVIDGHVDHDTIARTAVEYECRTNPVWPMPGACELMNVLLEKDIPMGIVSNAQFYTPLLFEALAGNTLEKLGFYSALCAWSYRMYEGKPSTQLYEWMIEHLETHYGISPASAMYVGNDMLNDIWPAHQLGMTTVLFAGDKRSLRLREGDERCAGIEPDYIITDVLQITEMII